MSFELPASSQLLEVRRVEESPAHSPSRVLSMDVQRRCSPRVTNPSDTVQVDGEYRSKVAIRISDRFRCQCATEHASFNSVNWTETERYTRTFARFFVQVVDRD